MNLRLIKLQTFGCGILSLVLAAEWAYGRFTLSQIHGLLEPQAQTDTAVEELPTITGNANSADIYSDIVERPVFIEGRKPLAEAETANIIEAQDPGQIDDWELIGVYDKGNRATALFRKRDESKKFSKIPEEQSISGWLLKKIHSDHVVLEQAGQEKAVVLRKPRAQVKPPIPGKPPTPQRLQPPHDVAKPVDPAPVPNETPENPE